MTWDSKTLPDKILRLVSPADRKALGKRGLTLCEVFERAKIKSERDLQNLIESYFRLHNVVAIRSRMDKKTTTPTGTPDFMLALKGQAIALEVKLPGEELSEEQKKMKEAMMATPNGWRWITVTDLEAVRQLLHTV
jgi:hypothetical protein